MQIHITASDGVPIYLQVVNQIKYLVAAGRLKAGFPEDRCNRAFRFLLPPSQTALKYLMLLLLRISPEEMANQYINTTEGTWLGFVAQVCRVRQVHGSA